MRDCELPGAALAGKTVLVTAGPTCEDIDPVRFITNRSTGRMGVAVAEAAAARGARVLLVHGPLAVAAPDGPSIETVPVRSAADMHRAVMAEAGRADAVVMAAAVADFTPVSKAGHKLKKQHKEKRSLELERTPDILAELGRLRKRPLLVGFAADNLDVDRRAQRKLVEKGCDLLCANDIGEPGSGFGCATNRVTIHRRTGAPLALPQLTKRETAERILDLVAEALHTRQPNGDRDRRS